MTTIPLWWYLIVAAGLFSIGIYGALVRRNAVNVLMGVELMLNAVNIAFVAASTHMHGVDGQIFVFFVITVAAAEAAVMLAIIIAVYRQRQSIDVDQMDLMQG